MLQNFQRQWNCWHISAKEFCWIFVLRSQDICCERNFVFSYICTEAVCSTWTWTERGDCARSWGFLWSGKCVCEREYVKRWGLIEGCKNWTVLFEVYLPSDANEDMMTKTTCVQAASKLKPEANGARVVAERENPGGRKSGKFDTRKVKKGNQGKGDKREKFLMDEKKRRQNVLLSLRISMFFPYSI